MTVIIPVKGLALNMDIFFVHFSSFELMSSVPADENNFKASIILTIPTTVTVIGSMLWKTSMGLGDTFVELW